MVYLTLFMNIFHGLFLFIYLRQMVEHLCVVTSDDLLLLSNNNYALKCRIPLTKIVRISLSSHGDHVGIIHLTAVSPC